MFQNTLGRASSGKLADFCKTIFGCISPRSGHRSIAQGNALGRSDQQPPALKGCRDHWRMSGTAPPFQGWKTVTPVTQGVALGYAALAFQAGRNGSTTGISGPFVLIRAHSWFCFFGCGQRLLWVLHILVAQNILAAASGRFVYYDGVFHEFISNPPTNFPDRLKSWLRNSTAS